MELADGMWGPRTAFAAKHFQSTREELLKELYESEQKVIELRLELAELKESNA